MIKATGPWDNVFLRLSKNYWRTRYILGVIFIVVLGNFQVANAQNPSYASEGNVPRYYINIDAAGVIFNSSGEIYIAGERLPGASIDAEDNPSLTVNLGYFATPHLSVDLLFGLPPHAALSGAGTASALGTAAYTNYAPAILSLLYHFNGLGNFHPFIGPGINYTLFLHTKGINLQDAKIGDHVGAAFTVGFDDNINSRWAFNVAVVKVLLSTQVKASDGPYPVEVKATANPTIIQAGVTYRF